MTKNILMSGVFRASGLLAFLAVLACDGDANAQGASSKANAPKSMAGAPTGDSKSRAGAAKAPSFSLKDQTGRVRRLKDFRGEYLVLYFYPKDATPGCTAEARAFRDTYKALRKAGAEVVGVSTDSVSSHARFAKDEGLPFSLLSDEDGKVAERYGVPVRFGFTSRITFLIDAKGRIVREFRDVSPDEHAGDILRLIKGSSYPPR